jgi:hypothetical protein
MSVTTLGGAATQRRGSVSVDEALRRQLQLYSLRASPTPSSSSSSSSSEEGPRHNLILLAGCTFHHTDRPAVYSLLRKIGRASKSFIYARAARRTSKKRKSAAKRGKALKTALDKFDCVDWGRVDFTTRAELAYWVARSLSQAMMSVPEDWKLSLRVVVVAARWALDPALGELIVAEDANTLEMLGSTTEIQSFMDTHMLTVP